MASQNQAPSAGELLADRTASFWLKSSIRTALIRDPVDAANDAETLARVMKARADAACGVEPGQAEEREAEMLGALRQAREVLARVEDSVLGYGVGEALRRIDKTLEEASRP